MMNPRGTAIYRNHDIMGASPIRLVIMTYDVAIQACEQQEVKRACDAVTLLRDSLNLDYRDSSEGFLRLYQWCLECIRDRDFNTAHGVLSELRRGLGQGRGTGRQLPWPAPPSSCQLARSGSLRPIQNTLGVAALLHEELTHPSPSLY